MLNLLYTEIRKLHRSPMVWTCLGAVVFMPVIKFLGFYSYHTSRGDSYTFASMCESTLMFLGIAVGLMLFGLVAAYLITREYQEQTLKAWLVIPVGRNMFILSKLIILYLMINLLMLVMFISGLILGLLFRLPDISMALILKNLKLYLFFANLEFLLMSPVVLCAFLFKSYMPAIGFTVFATFLVLFAFRSPYISHFPFSAPLVILFFDMMEPEISLQTAWVSILTTSAVCLTATFLYFNRCDIE